MLPKDKADFITRKYQQVLQGKREVIYEDSIDDICYGESILSPIMDENNEVSHIISITRDVSKRVIAEERLKESEERYRLITDNSKSLISLINTDGLITYASPSHQNIMGIGPDTFINKPIENYSEQISGFQSNFLRDVFEKNQYHSFECKMKANDGDIFLSFDLIPIIRGNKHVEKVLLVGENITARKIYEEEIHKMAYYDYLTGLPNIQMFKGLFQDALVNGEMVGRKLALLYVDCDHFKPINDNYGHDVGDQFLKEFAERLLESVSTDDVVSRIGGDEFNILLLGMENFQQIEARIEDMFQVINEPWRYDGKNIPITTSIGVSVYPDDGLEMKELIKKADIGLYKAKNHGRNQYKFYGR